MSLSRAAIVDQLKEIVGADRVITDETVLKKNSIDRFRKFPDIHGIYTLPIPAAAAVCMEIFSLCWRQLRWR